MYNVVYELCNQLDLHINLRYVHDTVIVNNTNA
jgi:hypothetical protein